MAAWVTGEGARWVRLNPCACATERGEGARGRLQTADLEVSWSEPEPRADDPLLTARPTPQELTRIREARWERVWVSWRAPEVAAQTLEALRAAPGGLLLVNLELFDRDPAEVGELRLRRAELLSLPSQAPPPAPPLAEPAPTSPAPPSP